MLKYSNALYSVVRLFVRLVMDSKMNYRYRWRTKTNIAEGPRNEPSAHTLSTTTQLCKNPLWKGESMAFTISYQP